MASAFVMQSNVSVFVVLFKCIWPLWPWRLPSEIDRLWAAVPEDLKPHYVALMEHAARHALKFELNYAKLVHQDAFLDQDENYRRFEQNMERFNRNRGKPDGDAD